MKLVLSNRFALLTLFLAIIMLAACTPDTVTSTESMFTDISGGSGSQMKLHEAGYGSVERTASSEVTFTFAGARAVVSDIKGGTLKELRVKPQQEVTAGEVIAVLSVDYSKADLDNLKSALEIAKRQLDNEMIRYVTAVSVATEMLATTVTSDATPRDIRRAELKLEVANLDMQDFNRRYDERIAAAEKAISDFEHDYLRTEIIAPISGVISSLQLLQVGKYVAQNEFICSVYPADTLRIIGKVEQSNSFRFNQTAELSVGNSSNSFPVRILSAPNVYGSVVGEFTAELDDSVSISDSDIAQFSRARFSITATRYRLDDVLIVPQSAIQNENSNFFVRIYEDGTVKKRFVVTGLSDSKNVQILDGLTAGQSVIVG